MRTGNKKLSGKGAIAVRLDSALQGLPLNIVRR